MFISAVLLISSLSTAKAEAKIGDMGFYGAITAGTRLPKTTELLLQQEVRPANTPVVYKEIAMIDGSAVEVDGLLTVKRNGAPTDGADAGKFTETHDVRPAANGAENSITRSITYDVNWKRNGIQITYDYKVTRWTETLRIGGMDYRLQQARSHFDVSALEYKTAGVTYYKADISQRSVYTSGDGGELTTVESYGSVYGYDCAWSSTETHRTEVMVSTDAWQLQYEVRPSVSVNKTLQYSANEPTAISFSGNYREVMENKSGLQYDIKVLPRQFYQTPLSGSAFIPTTNAFEQLFAPDTSWLKGSFSEADINKLFSMGVLSGDTRHYNPSHAITRGEYITMLVKAIKLPIDTSYQTQTARGRKPVAVNIVFPDVLQDRADYPYIMAAYASNIAIGRGTGHFFPDSVIQREEAIVMMLRAIGLSNLGLEPTPITPYMDDAKISAWAKKDIYAATRLGLILPDEQGNISPKANLTKAEAAALVNRLIEYMRTELPLDYMEHIVNYTS